MREAQEGNQRAVEELVTASLPLVYNIVGRAMDGHPDVDDVVQNTMLRVVANLGTLEDPERFQAWLAAIAVRQVRTWWDARGRRAEPAPPEKLGLEVDPQADFTDLTLLRLDLVGQRKQAVEATRWLEAEERETLSLWWMEAAGQLTRAQWASSAEMTPQYAAVRVKRVRERLEAARSVLRALGAVPRCDALDSLLPSWDGRPSPLWRKRLHRHVRDCPRCRQAVAGLIPAEGLLENLALVPLPIGLLAHVVSSLPEFSVAQAGLDTAHPNVASPSRNGADPMAAGPRQVARAFRAASGPKSGPLAVAAAATVTALAVTGLALWNFRSEPSSPPPAAVLETPSSRSTISPPSAMPSPSLSSQEPPVSPTPSARVTISGDHTLRSLSFADQYVAAPGKMAILVTVTPFSSSGQRQAATFTFVPGLADRTCSSLRDRSGRYLRHNRFRLRLDLPDGSRLFASDATFCLRPGQVDGSVHLESLNYPGRFVHRRADAQLSQLWLDPAQDAGPGQVRGAFEVVAPLAR